MDGNRRTHVGTGFVVASDGLIATCSHVVREVEDKGGGNVNVIEAKNITVQWPDGTATPAEVHTSSKGTPDLLKESVTKDFDGDLAGIKVQHVPYTSYSQAVTDMISGRISLWITTLGGAIGNIQAGKMRALAVSGRQRGWATGVSVW